MEGLLRGEEEKVEERRIVREKWRRRKIKREGGVGGVG